MTSDATSDAGDRGNAPSTLSRTIGRLRVPEDAPRLSGADREALVAWQESAWRDLESRSGLDLPRDPERWYEMLIGEEWREARPPRALPSWALAFFYVVKRVIPRRLQLWLRRRLIRLQGSPAFPAWPYESAGATLIRLEFARQMLEQDVTEVRFPWFWPSGARAAAVLTHDVESADGLRNSPNVGAWEEELGFRSSFNVVREWYEIDWDIIDQLRAGGHEIGSHAIHHDRRLFESREAFEQGLPQLRAAASDLGAVGFRSPATHRVNAWMHELPFEYDCTMPHSDPYEPIPGGVATTLPFWLGDVVELPYTAPQDHTLYNLLGHRSAELWIEQLDRVTADGGLLQLITHPDPGYLEVPLIADAYRELLRELAQRSDVWVALPKEAAAWWRGRETGAVRLSEGRAHWDGSSLQFGPRETATQVQETTSV